MFEDKYRDFFMLTIGNMYIPRFDASMLYRITVWRKNTGVNKGLIYNDPMNQLKFSSRV